jgi:hypothetical protein
MVAYKRASLGGLMDPREALSVAYSAIHLQLGRVSEHFLSPALPG